MKCAPDYLSAGHWRLVIPYGEDRPVWAEVLRAVGLPDLALDHPGPALGNNPSPSGPAWVQLAVEAAYFGRGDELRGMAGASLAVMHAQLRRRARELVELLRDDPVLREAAAALCALRDEGEDAGRLAEFLDAALLRARADAVRRADESGQSRLLRPRRWT